MTGWIELVAAPDSDNIEDDGGKMDGQRSRRGGVRV